MKTLPNNSCIYIRSKTPILWIKWDGKPSGYVENPDNCIFDVITSHGKLDRGTVWKNVTSHAQGREPTPV